VSHRLVILDRDGVINHDSDDYIKSPGEWRPIDGSLDAIARLSGAGYTVAVATNQSGLGRGLFDVAALDAIHDKLQRLVRVAGGDIARIVYCPHRPDAGCDCRKPSPGLLVRLAGHFGVPLDGVPVIGDSVRDIEAARAVSGRPILVMSGNGRTSASVLADRGESVETFEDLTTAADFLVGLS